MFSFGGPPAPAPAAAATAPSSNNNYIIVIPDLYDIFPYWRLAEEIANGGGRIQQGTTAADLENRICAALVDMPATAAGPDEPLRHRLAYDPHLLLQIKNNHHHHHGQDQGTATASTTSTTTAKLPPYMLPDIIEIANVLQIPEATAIGLYHHAATTSTTTTTNTTSSSVKESALQLYWNGRLQQLQLAKHALVRGLRQKDGDNTDGNNDDDDDVMSFLWSSPHLLQHAARGLQLRTLLPHHHPIHQRFSTHLHQERNVLAEIVYFAAYQISQAQAQSSSSQQQQLVDLVANVTDQEQVDVLDAFRQVPSPHTTASAQQTLWERALVEGAYRIHLPPLLQTYAILVAAVSCHIPPSHHQHSSSSSSSSTASSPGTGGSSPKRLNLSELRYTIIPALSTLPLEADGLVVTRDFCFTSIGQYLINAVPHHLQHQSDWYACANLLCTLGFGWIFVDNNGIHHHHGPTVTNDSDDPHALVYAYHTHQTTLSPAESNRVLRRYQSQLDGSASKNNASSTSSNRPRGNAYYGGSYNNNSYDPVEEDMAAVPVVHQRTLGDADRSYVMAHALHANDLSLVLSFALGTPIDRHVRGVLFEAASRIIATAASSSNSYGTPTTGRDDPSDDAAAAATSRADHALRLLAEFHAVPPQQRNTATSLSQPHPYYHPAPSPPPHTNFMFFMPSDVTKAATNQQLQDAHGVGRFDATYGMLFSVLIAERDTGYEATIGFLRLLTTIAHYTVLPARYAEYALFVLDHVTTAHTDRDRDCVSAAALEFLQAILVRYDHPHPGAVLSSSPAFHKTAFGYDELNRHLVVAPSSSGTVEPPVSLSQQRRDAALTGGAAAVVAATQPDDSAGFFVLVSMLSRNRGSLFEKIIDVLTRRRRRSSNETNVAGGNDVVLSHDQLTLTRALYRETPPSLTTARIGVARQPTAEDRKGAAERERQNLVFLTSDDYAVQSLQSALTILCATLMREPESANHILKYIPTLNSGKQINDVMIIRSHHLVHLFAEAGPSAWGALIESIGIETCDPVVEAMVSSLATAALWGLLDKLPLPQIAQVLHTQLDNRPGGTSLAKAVTRRLESYSSRPLQSEDISYLRFLLKSILVDLKSAQKMISSSLFGSSSRVMEALLHLLESDEFLFGDESADVAVLCYEAVYLLTKIGGNIGDVLVAAKRAARLREMDFWNVSLERLFRSGQSTTVHHLLAVAWLLQGFANELYLVGGATSAVAVVVPPVDQQLLAPQPYLLGRYVSDLMLEDNAFVREALNMLPLEKAVPISPPSCLSTEVAQTALESAKEEYPGPAGMTAYVVNPTLLADKLGKSFQGRDQVELWVESYNTAVFVECAAAHLSDALSLVVGAAASAQYFPSTDNDRTVAGSKRVFSELLDLMSRQGHLRPATARSLAKMVFVITGTLSNAALDDEFIRSALRQVLPAISNIAGQASSFNDNDKLYEDGTVAILTSVFSLLFRSSTGPDYRLDDGDLRDISAAIRSLVPAGLAHSEASSTIRILLCDLIDISRSSTSEVDNDLGQFFRSVLSDRTGVPGVGLVSSATALARLVPEEEALLVIGELVTIPDIAGFMIDQGVVTALATAAQNYKADEARRLREHQQSLSHRAPVIHFPPNLSAILKCLSIFMTSSDRDAGRRTELFVNATGILQCFEDVLYHTANNFPKNGSANLLLEFTRFLFQVHTFKRSLSKDTQPVLISARSDDDIPSYTKAVARLSLHVSEYLLPSAHNSSNGLRVWWDDVDTGASGSFSKSTCQTAVQAAELSYLGLSLLIDLAKEDRIDIGKLDEAEMCQAIRRCFEALMYVKREMGSFVGVPGTDPSLADLPDVEGLFRKGHDLLATLFLTALARTESIKKSIHGPRGNNVFIETSRTMEQLRHVDVLDGAVHQDENRQGILSQLVDAVKKECGSAVNSAFLTF